MKKWMGIVTAAVLALLTVSCGQASVSPPAAVPATKENADDQKDLPEKKGSGKYMRLRTASGQEILFVLNDSPAADRLYRQLPMSVKVEDFSNNEKIFYPPDKLPTENTPKAQSKEAGTLAYYAPWGDVVMFYGSYSPSGDLYELGQVQSGGELIPQLSGEVRLEP